MAGLSILMLVALLATVSFVLLRGRGLGIASPSRRRTRPSSTPTGPPPPPQVAERRAMGLLRSVVNHDEWAMFRDLGFICLAGSSPRRAGATRYRYLIYPHLPVVALLPGSLAPVREYCIQFPDVDGERQGLLPVGDDMLAKWMTLRGDEDRMLSFANVTGAGCQIPIARIEADLERLRRWRSRRRLTEVPARA